MKQKFGICSLLLCWMTSSFTTPLMASENYSMSARATVLLVRDEPAIELVIMTEGNEFLSLVVSSDGRSIISAPILKENGEYIALVWQSKDENKIIYLDLVCYSASKGLSRLRTVAASPQIEECIYEAYLNQVGEIGISWVEIREQAETKQTQLNLSELF